MPEPPAPSLKNIIRRRALPGLLLFAFDAQATLLSWNSAARQILHHRNDQGQLLRKIQKAVRLLNKALLQRNSSVTFPAKPLLQMTFSSGRCPCALRVFFLDNPNGNGPPLVAVLLEQINPSRLDLPKAQRLFGLSPREIEVIHALQNGMTDKEIASALGISPETARGYLKAARAKLGVSTRTAILHKLLSM